MIRHLKKTYTIEASVSKVWDALTNPDQIRRYYFGTEASSNWRQGGTIWYRGVWEGKRYEDKGIIEELIPERKLTINHWSSRTGKPDSPENYHPHTYTLTPTGERTKVTLTQEDNYQSDEHRAKAWQHWDVVMDGLNKVLQMPLPKKMPPPAFVHERVARQR